MKVCKVLGADRKEVCIKFVRQCDIGGDINIGFLNRLNQLENCIKTNRVLALSPDYKPYTHLIETEYANLGSLYAFLDTRPKKRLVYALLFEVIKGVGYLHKNGVLHNDLKPSNILVVFKKNRYGIRFNDFNPANKTEGPDNDLTICTPEYTAPEIVNKERPSARSDIWALGVLIYELFTGKLPFGSRLDKLSPKQIFKNIVNNSLPDFSAIPAPFDKIVQECLVKNVEDRPGSIKELLQRSKVNTSVLITALYSSG